MLELLNSVALVSVFFALVVGLCFMALIEDCEMRDNGFDEEEVVISDRAKGGPIKNLQPWGREDGTETFIPLSECRANNIGTQIDRDGDVIRNQWRMVYGKEEIVNIIDGRRHIIPGDPGPELLDLGSGGKIKPFCNIKAESDLGPDWSSVVMNTELLNIKKRKSGEAHKTDLQKMKALLESFGEEITEDINDDTTRDLCNPDYSIVLQFDKDGTFLCSVPQPW